jgi:GNAT superfamily N-acetyltransferase
LVACDRAHGILVYANEEPVGWCQFGLSDELPRIDNSRRYARLAPAKTNRKLWRITCFVVMKDFRKKGVATVALQAALASIKAKGGGLVEAYPISRWLSRAFGNESTHGTASMFAKQGFKPVAPFGSTRFSSHVLMRRTV